MRSTALLRVRALPLSSLPPSSLRLPPKPQLKKLDLNSTSPTIDKLLASFATRTAQRAGQAAPGGEFAELPKNLRIVEYVPKRREYEGVRAGHRDLLRRLRREA